VLNLNTYSNTSVAYLSRVIPWNLASASSLLRDIASRMIVTSAFSTPLPTFPDPQVKNWKMS
jgi:hypothetical protein